jgi:hypothetical protein
MRPPERPVWEENAGSPPDPTLSAFYQRTLAPLSPDADRLYRARTRLALAEARSASHATLLRRGLWTVGVLAIAGTATAIWLGTRTSNPTDPIPATTTVEAPPAGSPIMPSEPPPVMPAPRPTLPAAGARATSHARSRRVDVPTPGRRIAHAESLSPGGATAGRKPALDEDAPQEIAGGTAVDPATAEGSSPLADESRRLAEVYAQLRRLRNPDAALAEIAGYMRAHPDGVLMNEARLAQIDAYLLKGQSDEALAALGRVQLGSRPRELELRLMRGELRARTDCRAARVDFSAVLAAAAGEALHERALRGRAGCELREGDRAAARLDLTEYLRRFPDSQHAPRARAQLEAAPPP